MISRLSRRAALGALSGAALLPGGAALWPAGAAAATNLDDGALGGALRGSIDATQHGLHPGAPDDQSAAFARALAQAESEAKVLFLPPGRYGVAAIDLPRQTRIAGVPGQSVLVFRGGPFMLRARNAATLRFSGVSLDGKRLPLEARALLDADGAGDAVIDDCDFFSSAAAGLALRAVAGRVENSRVQKCRTAGIDIDMARGMAVTGNAVGDCGDTGILVERDAKGADDTIVSGNRVRDIRADSGGSGQNGNGINLDKAANVIVTGNRVENCAFSAFRAFSSDAVQVANNVFSNSGEVALYVEFAFEGAVVANNLIDGGREGIVFANFLEHGGRLATCSGNVVRRIAGGPAYPGGAPRMGAGIAAEADVAIAGNVVEDAWRGLQLGWGPHLRDVTATGNVIRRTRVGIAVSVVEGGGPALISQNLITGATEAAILGMRWDEAATGDLAKDASEAPEWISVAGNVVG